MLTYHNCVMPGLVPGIHVARAGVMLGAGRFSPATRNRDDVDGRDKPGHDGGVCG